jgi:type VI secretion system protein ImpG
MDFEVYRVTQVMGYGTSAEQETEFLPFYALTDLTNRPGHGAFYTTHRVPRLLSTKQRQYGARSGYVGSEVFLSLVDADQAPYHHDLRQLGLSTLCTNRDLPLHMPIGQGRTDFTLQASAPVQAVRCVAGPTKPKPSPVYAEGEFSWRLISHLSLNYLTLLDNDQRQGAAAIRELLTLYADTGASVIRKQIEGVRSVTSAPAIRRIGASGALAFGRGLEIAVTFDESAFEGAGVFLLGAVLERFFAKYTSINSFTETVVNTLDRGEIMRWPARTGTRQTV